MEWRKLTTFELAGDTKSQVMSFNQTYPLIISVQVDRSQLIQILYFREKLTDTELQASRKLQKVKIHINLHFLNE